MVWVRLLSSNLAQSSAAVLVEDGRQLSILVREGAIVQSDGWVGSFAL